MSEFLEQVASRYAEFQQILARWRPSRIPSIIQNQGSECGAAALAMVLGSYGHHVTLSDTRERVPITPGSGASADHILSAAHTYGLRGRAVACDLDDLRILPSGAILHWQMFHWVVLERADDLGVSVVDPAVGRITLSWKETGKSFTGVALLLEPGEAFRNKERPPSPIRRWLKEITSEPAWPRVALMGLTLQVLAFSLPALTGIVVERVVPQADRQLLAVAVVATLLFGLFQWLAYLVRARISSLIMMRVGVRMRVDFTERLMRAPMQFVFDRSAGSISYLQSNIDTVLQSLTSATLSAVVDGAMALLFLIILLAAAPTMGLAVMLVFAVQAAVSWWSFKRLGQVAASELHVARKLATMVTESVQGFETVKSLGLEATRISTSMTSVAGMAQARMEGDSVQSLSDSLQSMIRYIAPLSVLLLGARSVLDGSLSIGQMLSLSALATQTLLPLASLTTLFGILPRINQYFIELEDIFAAVPEQDPESRRQAPPLLGEIRIDHVTFRYSALLPIVLRDIDLTVRPGEFLAIVGRSGCGKSTLASVILGLLRPESGHVEFDGEEVDRLELASLRKQLGYVPQRPYIFSTTVRENLTVGDPSIPLERVMEAAKLAQIHEEILALPLGYQTGVSNFATFSGGERQRLAIARALVRAPKILLLDEATSAMDTVTEAQLARVIESLGCTRIVIAHRLSTIEKADRIVVMDNGAVVGLGTFQELLETNPVFQTLYKRKDTLTEG